MTKRIMFWILLLICISYLCFSEWEVRVNGGICADFMQLPDFNEVMDAVSKDNNGNFWGIGWEVILDYFGLGGNYMVNFQRDIKQEWSVNWYGEALYVSYHFFGAQAFIDPFAQIGIGNAGGISLGEYDSAPYYEEGTLLLTLFPFVSAGCAFNFDGLLIGTKINYSPLISPVPVTDFGEYPLQNVQAIVFIGFSIGGK